MGSKYLQDRYLLSISEADSLILLPEGMIVLVALPLGIWLDKQQIDTSKKMVYLASACAALCLSYSLLAFSIVPPIVMIK
jgi:hypothetical protein